jgi:hypothetical protein
MEPQRFAIVRSEAAAGRRAERVQAPFRQLARD